MPPSAPSDAGIGASLTTGCLWAGFARHTARTPKVLGAARQLADPHNPEEFTPRRREDRGAHAATSQLGCELTRIGVGARRRWPRLHQQLRVSVVRSVVQPRATNASEYDTPGEDKRVTVGA